MTDHTKGPWYLSKHKMETGRFVVFQDSYAAGTNEWPEPFIHQGYSEQNARLIAAAPELLSALEEIHAINDEPLGVFRKRGGTRRGLSMSLARAAIAKARSMK